MASFELSFRARTAAALVALTSFTLVAASSMVAGCSSSSDSSSPDAASQDCPVTLADAITNSPKCSTDREACVVGFVCPGELNETATCNCTGGSWACTDHAGNAITDPTAGSTCTALGGGNDKECPADEGSASFAACTTAGLICSYKGATCTGQSVANTDTCQCVGGGDGGLEFKCEPNTCPGPALDSGTADAGDAH